MRELEHDDLFRPPEGTLAVVIPVCGEVWKAPPMTYKTPMERGYARIAKARWPKLDINLGVLQRTLGATPHPLTASRGDDRIYLPGKKGQRGRALSYHLISLPTRKYADEPINLDFLTTKLRALTQLCAEIPWLQGDAAIVLPQIADKDQDRGWAYFRRHVEPWLSDRFIVISGKKGLPT